MTSDLRSRLLPVLDLMGGAVVQGVGGRRDEYRPVSWPWCRSTRPLEVARKISKRYGFDQFYVADLDAIRGGEAHWSELRNLAASGFRLWIDAGVRTAADLAPVFSSGADRVVVGLETVESPRELKRLVEVAGSDRLVFSLDLKNGRPLTATGQWSDSADEIADVAIAAGIASLIVLDLSAVGGDAGCPTLPFCETLRRRHANIELLTGGGVRSIADVQAAKRVGVDRLLISSALGAGRFDTELLRVE